jgi:TolB-like protein/class 3 adenylate cyclase/Tfp pilus assembly protein PilF
MLLRTPQLCSETRLSISAMEVAATAGTARNAADVVGYSRLMQADEAGTLAALKTRRKEILQPLLAKHHGRVVKVMGDGVLVEFASAVEAVECAVELQDAMASANANLTDERRIVLRIGITLGHVMVEGSDLYGDGVNIAARLEASAEPGSVCVSQTVFSHVRGKVRLTFDDLGERHLKNIAEPVRLYRISRTPSPTEAVHIHRTGSTTPAIAVLPVTNMSGDPDQEYFSDGITEDIITELSRFRNLAVIARNSSFAYKGKAANVATIARELKVDYVLEGSVRRAGQRARVTAQLIQAASASHVWAQRYDRELTDIFAVQDEITQSIVGTMAVELDEQALKQAKQKSPEDVRAYEHWLRGKSIIYLMGLNILLARQHFERAVAVDPSYARAHSGLSQTYMWEALEFPLPDDSRTAAWNKASEHARQAVSLDDTDDEAHLILAFSYLYSGGCDLAKKHIDRAIMLNPNAADTLANATYVLTALGEAGRAVECGQTALRLNPHRPDWYITYLSFALFTARRYAEALAFRVSARDVFIDSRFVEAAILTHLGRLDEARHSADVAMRRLAATPGGSLAIAECRVVELLLENNPYCRQEDRDHFAEGMRKAGIPG